MYGDPSKAGLYAMPPHTVTAAYRTVSLALDNTKGHIAAQLATQKTLPHSTWHAAYICYNILVIIVTVC